MDSTTNFVVAFLSMQIGIVCALIPYGNLRNWLNTRLGRLLDSLSSLRRTKFFTALAYNTIRPTIGLVAAFILLIAIPAHDFVLLDAPNDHAVFSSLRYVAVFLFGLYALPLWTAVLAISLITYITFLLRVAAKAAGDDILALVGLILSLASLAFAALDAKPFLVACAFALQVIVLLVLLRSSLANFRQLGDGRWRILFGHAIYAARRSVFLVFQALFATFSVGALWIAYFAIFVDGREMVRWSNDLPCPVTFKDMLTIDDILVGHDPDGVQIFQRTDVEPLPPHFVFSRGNASLYIAVKAHGDATHARINVILQGDRDEGRTVLASHSAGGFFLGRGQFVTILSLSELEKNWVPGISKATLRISIAPQGSKEVTFAGQNWAFFAQREFAVERLASGPKYQYSLKTKTPKFEVLKCSFFSSSGNEE